MFKYFSDHSLFKKWAQLESKTPEHQVCNAGYLQLDLSVKSMLEAPAPFTNVLADDDELERYFCIKITIDFLF